MFMTPEELADLTHKVRPSAQARILAAMGIEFKMRPDKTLAVLRSHAEDVMSGRIQTAQRKPAKRQFTIYNPDGSALATT